MVSIGIFAAALGFAFPAISFGQTPLSNLLPVELVRQIHQENLWNPAFDEPSSKRGKELIFFWETLNTVSVANVDSLVSQIFGSVEDNSLQLPELYPIKVLIFRNALEVNISKNVSSSANPETSPLLLAEKKWKRRYVEMTLTAVELSGIGELAKTARRFMERVNQGSLNVVDLTLSERKRISQLIGGSHGTSLEARSADGSYFITGVFEASRDIFALDFARPIEQTLVSFVHEMVHAANPTIEGYRKTYAQLSPRALEILAKWCSDLPDPIGLAKDVIDHFFFEAGLYEEQGILTQLRDRQIKNLQRAIAERKQKSLGEGGFAIREELDEKEMETLRLWIRAAVGMTIENEYRAYGLSLLMYSVLKNRYQLFPPNKRLQEGIEKFLSGDSWIKNNLWANMQPNFRSQFKNLFSRMSIDSPQKQSSLSVFEMKLRGVLETLEILYLEEVRRFVSQANQPFSVALRLTEKETIAAESVLPRYARPGGFDSPENPFNLNLLTVRLTTAWVMRFRQTAEAITQDFKSILEPLLTLQLGILDLHDITVGERKLLGLTYDGNPWAEDPPNLDVSLRRDLDEVSPNVAKYFKVQKWEPKVFFNYQPLPGSELSQSLFRLRLLKAASWSEIGIPKMTETMLGVRAFIQRLREGTYDKSHLSRERAELLLAQLVDTWNIAKVTREDVSRLHGLVKQMQTLERLAKQDETLSEVSNVFLTRMQTLVANLDMYGLYGDKDSEELSQGDEKAKKSFHQQLEPYQKSCEGSAAEIEKSKSKRADEKRNPKMDLAPTKEYGDFEIAEFHLPLTIVCHRGKIHLVRSPGDTQGYMEVQPAGNAVEARIFVMSRPILLSPMSFPEKKKPKSCIWIFCN